MREWRVHEVEIGDRKAWVVGYEPCVMSLFTVFENHYLGDGNGAEVAHFIVNACNQYEERLAMVGKPVGEEGPE